MSNTKLSWAQMRKKKDLQRYRNIQVAKMHGKSASRKSLIQIMSRVSVIDRGGVEIDKANHAAREVQQELRLQHDLLTS